MPSPTAKPAMKSFDPNRALRIHRNTEYPKEIWYLVGGVIAVLSLWNFVSFLWSLRPKSPPITQAASSEVASDDSSSKHQRTNKPLATMSVRRIPLAVASAFKIVAFRSTVSLGGGLTVTLAEITIVLGYLVAILIWGFINTRNITTHKNLDFPFWANRAGTIAASQTTLIVALAGRNNIISLLTGIGYERLNIVHRGVSRAVLLMVWIHAAGRWKLGMAEWWDTTWLRSGFVSAAAYTLLLIVSIRPIRKAAYEFFCYSHLVLVLMMLFGAYFHMQQFTQLGYYVWPALLVWAIDRVIRLGRLLIFNFPFHARTSPSTLELLSPDTIRLTVHRRHISWTPGQSMFLTLPEISSLPFESHPFTISTVSSSRGSNGSQGEKELVFIIRARRGLTARLRDAARDLHQKTINVILDGPYGSPPDLSSFSTVTLLAGGSGVSYCLPLFTNLVRRAGEGKGHCRRIVFIWSVRDPRHMQWISASLVQTISEAPSHLQVAVQVHVTGQHIAGLHSTPTTEKMPETPVGSSSSNEELSFSGESSVDSHGEITSTSVIELLKMSAVTVVKGRPDVRRIIDEEISCALGDVSVDVCGPHDLAEAVRSALKSEIAGPMGVAKGRASVTLHVQKFGIA